MHYLYARACVCIMQRDAAHVSLAYMNFRELSIILLIVHRIERILNLEKLLPLNLNISEYQQDSFTLQI